MAYNSTYAAGKEERVYNFDAGVSPAAAGRAGSVSVPGTGARARRDAGTRAGQGVSAENPRRRTVSRAPDMSAPRARTKTPSVSIGLGDISAAPSVRTKQEAAPRIRTIRETAHVPLPVGAVLTSLVCTVLFMFMIYNFVQINESTIYVSSLRVELSSLMSEEKELSLKLEKKNDLRAIEEYAVSSLGMVKNDQLPKKYVNIDSQDKIEPGTEESVEGGAVSSALDALKERFGEIMEYIN